MQKNEEIETNIVTEPLETQPKPKKKKKKNHFLNIVIILIITLGYSIYSLWGSFDDVLSALQSPTANYYFFIVLLVIILIYFFIDGLILFFFARLYTSTYRLHRGIANSFIGQFYASITPSSSGRQFAQVVTFNKQGITVSTSASIVVMYYIIYQLVLIVFGLFSMAVNFEDFFLKGATILFLGLQIPLWVFALAGFGVSATIVIVLLLASLSKKIHHFVINNLIGFLGKIKLVRNPELRKKKLMITTENFRIELKRLSSNIPATIMISVLFVIKFTLFYSISYFVALMLDPSLSGFGIYIQSLTRSSFHQMVIGIIPIPGGAGVSEYLFEMMFSPIYANAVNPGAFVKAVQLVWRAFTFYFSLLTGGFVAALYRSSMEEFVQKEGDKLATFSDIQLETYAERKISSDTAYATSQLSVTEIRRRLKKKGK